MDLNDNSVQSEREMYISVISTIENIALASRRSKETKHVDVAFLISKVSNYMERLMKGASRLIRIFFMTVISISSKEITTIAKRGSKRKRSDKAVREDQWMQTDLETSLEECNKLVAQLELVLDKQLTAEVDLKPTFGEVCHYTMKKFILISYVKIRECGPKVVGGATRLLRTPASHCLVFMISPEERTRKPYALPVQMLPCRGILDGLMRKLADRVKERMVTLGVDVCGE